MAKAHDPITPGEILREEFLEPMGISAYRLAQATHISGTRLGEILRGTRRITPDTALRLSKALGLSDGFWIAIQSDYDLARELDHPHAALAKVQRLAAV